MSKFDVGALAAGSEWFVDEDNRSKWAALAVLGITPWEKFKPDSVTVLITSRFIRQESLLWFILFMTLPSDMRLFILSSRFPLVVFSKSTIFVDFCVDMCVDTADVNTFW